MQFMIMHKMTEEMEKGLPPEPAIMEGVGNLIAEGLDKKVFVSGEGLKPSSERTHLAYRAGTRTVTEGPFEDAKELIAGFAIFRVRSKGEAIGYCDEFAAALGGDTEIFLGPIVEPWDLGMMPKPEGAPLRFLAMHRMDEATEAELPLDRARRERLDALVRKLSDSGVLQATARLKSTKRGARIRFEGGKRKVIDGPFAESKELIAGYAILNLDSFEEAIGWGEKFGEIVRVEEVDVREVATD